MISLDANKVDSSLKGEGGNIMIKVEQLLKLKECDVWSVSPHDSVIHALQVLADKDVGALLVIEGGKLMGIFSERDYARKIVLKGKASFDTPIWEIMSQDPTTITEETSLEDCMRLMTEKRIRHLPVMSGNRVVGVLSIGDIVKAIINEQAGKIDSLERYIAGVDYNQ
jgi:CBS domain-containing protein